MKLIYVAFLSVALVGCGREEFQDLRDFVKNAGADMRGKIHPRQKLNHMSHFHMTTRIIWQTLSNPASRICMLEVKQV
jgi:Tfp pilus assembly protein PilP